MDQRYFWSTRSSESLAEWLKKVLADIRIELTEDSPINHYRRSNSLDLGEGDYAAPRGSREIVRAWRGTLESSGDHLTARLDEIQHDDSIPVRAKKGSKSKKQVRDEAHENARAELAKLSKESKWTVGKWLFFPRNQEVDHIWSTIARSVVEGPLKAAGIDLAKVAPAPRSLAEGESPIQVICIYMDDVYDKVAVTKVGVLKDTYSSQVLETLLREHGLEPSACKSDLYTLAGIDSKHPSGLRSSIWRPSELIEGGGAAIKAIKDEYKASKRAPGDTKVAVGADGIIESESEDERIVLAAKRKPEPVTSTESKGVKPPIAKRIKSAALKYQEEDIFAANDDSD